MGIYLHDDELLSLHKTNPIYSRETSYQRWTETCLDRPCWSVHESGRVCPGMDGSRSKPSDMDSGKLAFVSWVPRPA